MARFTVPSATPSPPTSPNARSTSSSPTTERVSRIRSATLSPPSSPRGSHIIRRNSRIIPKSPNVDRRLANGERINKDIAADVVHVLDHPNIIRLRLVESVREGPSGQNTTWDLCDAGSLDQLMQKEGQGLPEPLIWYTLISLTRAVHWLQTGLVDPNAEPPDRQPAPGWRPAAHDYMSPGWKPVVHNLINPANIFYRRSLDPDSAHGICQLGNFSRCVVLDDLAQASSVLPLHVESERTGYEAPELGSYDPYDGILGSRSDIWSIGAVCFAMMTGRTIWDFVMQLDIDAKRPARKDEDWRTVPPPEIHERLRAVLNGYRLSIELPKQYSTNLQTSVEWLISLDPARRDVRAMASFAETSYQIHLLELKTPELKEMVYDMATGELILPSGSIGG